MAQHRFLVAWEMSESISKLLILFACRAMKVVPSFCMVLSLLQKSFLVGARYVFAILKFNFSTCKSCVVLELQDSFQHGFLQSRCVLF